MINIGITGSDGLIGYHLRVFLRNTEGVDVRCANRHTFSSPESMNKFTKGLDYIVHLADKNVGADSDLRKINMTISESLLNSCEMSNTRPHILFASSTHTLLNPDAAYSISKEECSDFISDWCRHNGSDFTKIIIPHVFGEFGKPFYNSVVSSFCYQLANGESTKVIQDKELELLHAYDVARGISEIIDSNITGDKKLDGKKISVIDVRDKLIDLSKLYLDNIIPHTLSKLDCQLFNTFRSYLPENYYPRDYIQHVDERGMLFESIKAEYTGLTFCSTTKPGVTRGNHFHIDKFERFIVLKGEAIISFRKLFSEEVKSFEVSGASPTYVDMPTYTTHNIKNTGKSDLLTLFWSNVFFDPNHPDTYFEEV